MNRNRGKPWVVLLLLGCLLPGTGHGQDSPKLQQTAIITDGYGDRLAFTPGGLLAVADGYQVHFFEGATKQHSVVARYHTSTGELQVSIDGNSLLAGTLFVTGKNHRFEEPVETRDVFLPGPRRHGGYEVKVSTWSGDGKLSVQGLGYRPGRCKSCKGCEKTYDGPKRLVIVVDGATAARVACLESKWLGPMAVSAAHIAILDSNTLKVWNRADLPAPKEPEEGPKRGNIGGAASEKPVAPKLAVVEKTYGWLKMRFNPAGELLAAGEQQGWLTIKETGKYTTESRWQAHEEAASALAFHPTLPILATAGSDRKVHLWNIEGKPVKLATATLPPSEFDNPRPEDMAFSPDGTTLAVALYTLDRKVILYDVTTGAPRNKR